MFKTNSDEHSLSVFQKLKRRTKNEGSRLDSVIVNLNKKQIQIGSEHNKIMLNDQRRVIFISLIGLYTTWTSCPAPILNAAIFILPFKKKWIYCPKKYESEMNQTLIGKMQIFRDSLQFRQFLSLLKWKDSQNLFISMLDHDEYNTDLIAPFWKHLNDKLTELYNPITKSTYKPLKFNPKWWSKCVMHYQITYLDVLKELYLLTMKFRPMSEIIYQSNKDSFNIIQSWIYEYKYEYGTIPSKKSVRLKSDTKTSNKCSFVCDSIATENKIIDAAGFVSFTNGCCPDIDDYSSANDSGIWMISVDYNEYSEY